MIVIIYNDLEKRSHPVEKMFIKLQSSLCVLFSDFILRWWRLVREKLDIFVFNRLLIVAISYDEIDEMPDPIIDFA